ncbi:O-antigen translocase [Tabrizicola sp.]|uniref:O-antigen translocase n=1 Tax=Tabrizicola sp. TaxID=2005166 RepID=UPI0027331A61|nr:O-antigen translocase [Tabrizicola sp.]MDP3197164.1 O-antigen translocase [Tabrizicola sp.]MDZ4067895.1 O-antigen translocase [Tabrizicola sp.]
MSGSSYRTILRSSSIIGGAQVINIAVGLVKMKVVALLLGPAGVGLIGLYLSLIQTSSSVAAMGLGNVGTRQIAVAHAAGGDVAVGRTRRALFWGTMLLALTGAALFWLASGWIARVILADETRANDVAWLSLGVALTVAAGSQGALLTGLRRIGDIARINAGAGVIGAALGILALWLWGAQGLIAMVLIAPVVTFMLGHLYVARLGAPAGPPIRLPEMAREWKTMLTLGFAFMFSGLVTTLGHLAARTLVQRELGTEALGQFQAASAIGMTYLGFVLSAMGTDYYPRLTAAIGDRTTATRLVNEQTEVALLLCAPVLLAMLGLAPWVIHLLYSAEFAPAVEILRWQLLGDILKVMSWPLGFVLLAVGAGKTFILTESLGMGVFVLGVLIGLPLMGVTATGVAFLALYVAYLPLVWLLGGRMIGFRWTRAVKAQALAVIGAAVAVDIASRSSELLGAVLGLGLALATGIWALLRLSTMAGAGGRLGRITRLGERMNRWTL